ncbi:MAG: VTT domain-containing protein [Thermaerobacterales bacterium]
MLLAGLPVLLWGPARLIDTLQVLSTGGGLEPLLAQVRGFWPWTPLIMIVLMVMEAMLAPLPAGPIVAANTLFFGLWGGLVLSWLGALAGSLFCFWLARVYGQEFILKWLGGRSVRDVETITRTRGFQVVLLARLVPLANNVVSYVAGLSTIKTSTFLAASALGVLPWIGLYGFFAHDLLHARDYAVRLAVLGIALVTLYIITWRFARRKAKLRRGHGCIK